MPRPKPPSPLRTYSHLAAARRVPTEYELVTSRLLHYVARGGFEVNASMAAWYDRHQRGSRLAGVDWEAFADPRGTTYTTYVALQRAAEAHVDGVLRTIDETGYDHSLDPGWLDVLERVLAPARFPMHGFQMLAAYVGQMAPASRLVVAASFQAADEVRRIQRVAYRTAQLRRIRPHFGETSRGTWENDPMWQPLREAIERALVAFDWGEALVALNVCLKPAFDALVLEELVACARARGDALLAVIATSFAADARWHQDWTRALVAMAGDPHRAALSAWAGVWLPRARAAIAPFADVLGEQAIARAEARLTHAVARLGLETS
jgi:toluene monooxygenase system protein E